MSLDVQMLLPTARELGGMFSFQDFAGVPGLILWCIIVFIPLSGIDRRDACTGYTYILFCVAAGVVLLMGSPLRLINNPSGITQLLILTGLGVLAGVRWAAKPTEDLNPLLVNKSKTKATIIVKTEV